MLIHGTPRFHLDGAGFRHAGCPHLAAELFRVRPRLVVFGHIHVSYGREDIILDKMRQAHDEILGNWEGWVVFLEMGLVGLFGEDERVI